MTTFDVRSGIDEISLRVTVRVLLTCLDTLTLFLDEPGDDAEDLVSTCAHTVADLAQELVKYTG